MNSMRVDELYRYIWIQVHFIVITQSVRSTIKSFNAYNLYQILDFNNQSKVGEQIVMGTILCP